MLGVLVITIKIRIIRNIIFWGAILGSSYFEKLPYRRGSKEIMGVFIWDCVGIVWIKKQKQTPHDSFQTRNRAQAILQKMYWPPVDDTPENVLAAYAQNEQFLATPEHKITAAYTHQIILGS